MEEDRNMYKNANPLLSLQWRSAENLSCWNDPEGNIENILIPMLEIMRTLNAYSHIGLCCLDIKNIHITDRTIKISGEKPSAKMNCNPVFIAPEIKMGCCKDTSLAIVYSIGAILYRKLFNTEPSVDYAELFSVINYSDSIFCSNLDKKSISLLDRFIHHTFTISKYARWDLKRTVFEFEQILNSIRHL